MKENAQDFVLVCLSLQPFVFWSSHTDSWHPMAEEREEVVVEGDQMTLEAVQVTQEVHSRRRYLGLLAWIIPS